jgi:hypothetical protein
MSQLRKDVRSATTSNFELPMLSIAPPVTELPCTKLLANEKLLILNIFRVLTSAS